jgi:hypothetical protein
VVGSVVGDKLVYAKGFGVRSKGRAPVDRETIFQIRSTTKAFLSATMAIAPSTRANSIGTTASSTSSPNFRCTASWPTIFVTGRDSPVSIDSLKFECPLTMIPSIGTFSPGFISTRSPGDCEPVVDSLRAMVPYRPMSALPSSRPYLLTQSRHQPRGLIGPSTSVQEDGGMKNLQFAQLWLPFGWFW